MRRDVSVNAIQLTEENSQQVADWCAGRLVEETDLDGNVLIGVNVPTLTGTIRVGVGDYVVQNANGYFQPWSKNIFESTFEENNNA